MKSRFASLVILNIQSAFSLSLPSWQEFKKPKTLLKTIGIGVGAILLLADVGMVFVLNSQAMYKALKPVGLEQMLFLFTATMATVFIFVLSFTMALSLFSSSGIDSGFLVLPFKPHEMLAAKMGLVYFANALLGIFLMLITTIVYGIHEHPPIQFYLYGLLSALAIPIIPIGISYLILIPLMRVSSVFRNRNFIVYLAGFIGVGLALAFNFYIQSTMSQMQDPGFFANFSDPESLISRIGQAWIPSWLTWKALSDADRLWGALAVLGNLALGVAVAALIALAMGKPYVRCIQIFGETSLTRAKKGAARRAEKESRTARRPLASLLLRELRLMNREPSYFINGPFIVVLMPVLLVVIFAAQRSSLEEVMTMLGPLIAGPAGYLIPAAFGAFLGSSTSIACTAISRDAKALPWIRALPIRPLEYFGAKLLHAEIFTLWGMLIGCGAGWLLFKTSAFDLVLAAILSLLVSTAFNMGGLWLDTAFPRLKWDNPIAAMKQNLNAVIMILSVMGIIVALGAISFFTSLPRNVYALVYGAIFFGFILVWIKVYPPYAQKRLAKME
jgi:ABC-2 type transport system permease protein